MFILRNAKLHKKNELKILIIMYRMLSPAERFIIISGTLFGSIYLFSSSLCSLNDVILRRKIHYNYLDYNSLNKLIIANSCIILYSGLVFGYFTYNAIK